MKQILSAALIVAAVAQPALARETRFDADRKDVAQAQSDADQMSSLEATWLRTQVILAEAVLLELHGNQYLMDKIGADHTRNLRTVSLGLGRSLAPILAGAAVIKYVPQYQYAAFGEEVRQAHEHIADLRKEQNRQQAKISKDLSDAEKAELETQRNTLIAGREAEIKTLSERVAKTEASKPWLVRWSKPTIKWLGPIVGVGLILDGTASFAQLVVDPVAADDLESYLTRFVEDANDTLARR